MYLLKVEVWPALYAVSNLLYLEFIEDTITRMFKSHLCDLIMKFGFDFGGIRRQYSVSDSVPSPKTARVASPCLC